MILVAFLAFHTVGEPAPENNGTAHWGVSARVKALFRKSPLGEFVNDAGLLHDVERCCLLSKEGVSGTPTFRAIYTAEVTIVDDGENEALLRLFHDGRFVRFNGGGSRGRG